MYFETERLILREIRYADKSLLYAYDSSAEHRRYNPDPEKSFEEFEGIIQWLLDTQTTTPRLYHYMAICLKEDINTIIGSIHITIHDFVHQQAEIGYMVGPMYWGKGYAVEASQVMVRWAFETAGMHRLAALDIIHENEASIHVARRLGMREEGVHRHTRYFHKRWWDTCTFAMLKPEWQAHQHQQSQKPS